MASSKVLAVALLFGLCAALVQAQSYGDYGYGPGGYYGTGRRLMQADDGGYGYGGYGPYGGYGGLRRRNLLLVDLIQEDEALQGPGRELTQADPPTYGGPGYGDYGYGYGLTEGNNRRRLLQDSGSNYGDYGYGGYGY